MISQRISALLLSAAVAVSSVLHLPFSGGAAYAEDSAAVKYTVTEQELDAAGVEWQGSKQLTVYIRVTEGGADSKIGVSAWMGPDGTGKPSTKYLAGRNVLVGNAIQDNIVGKAGTGLYKFPALSLNKKTADGSEWVESYAEEVTVTIGAQTADTDFELLGISFDNGAVYAYEEGFSPDTTVTEATGFDIIEKTARDLLGMTLDYCSTMDKSKYQPASWDALQTALAAARTVYDKDGQDDAAYTEARAALEKVKAAMLFADTGTSEAPLPFRELSAEELVHHMGVGINLGNTLDGHSNFAPNETSWQSVVTTKAYIKALHDAGFNTVRIPVTWGGTIDRDTYEIKEEWLDRVQQIVDYCVSQGMYAIINIHHDGAEQSGWLRVAAEDIDAVYEKYECVWRNIAERFKDYDEHLIFESMNEITCMRDDMKNSQEAVDYDTPIIVNLNQIFVNVVRSTGSNNEKRWLAAVAHYANSGNHKDFVLPADTDAEHPHIMFAAHIYKANTNTTWTYDEVYQVVNGLKMMADKFDVPMYLGEYGNRTKTQEGTATGYNDAARAYFSEVVHRACQTAGVVPVVWDQGYSDDKYQTGLFTYWDREQCVPLFKSITDAMVRGTYLPNSELNDSWDYTDVVESPEIIPITSLELAEGATELVIGDVVDIVAVTQPADSNDAVLWSTDDDTVATVSRGRVTATGIGRTTIRACTQNGDATAEVTVTVYAAQGDNKAASVIAPDEVTIETGRSLQLDAALPEGAEGLLTYKSSDPSVITVSPTGRIFAVGSGAAYVTVTADSGAAELVRVVTTDDSGTAAALPEAAISSEGGENITINGIGKSKRVSLTADVGTAVAFFSDNSAVAAVGCLAVSADENGVVYADITGLTEGTAVVTALTASGASVSFNITVKKSNAPVVIGIAAGASTLLIVGIFTAVRKRAKRKNA